MRTAKTADVQMKTAWLVTWEGTSGLPEDPVAAILHHRMSASTVKDFVERLHVSLTCSPRERLLVGKKPESNPIPCKYNTLRAYTLWA